MAYSGENLSCLNQTVKGDFKLWLHRSTDPIATVRAAGYISDATARGMNVRDVVIVQDLTTPTTLLCTVVSITAGAADLTDGLAIPETNT